MTSQPIHFSSVHFVKSAVKTSQFPPPLLPEIAVAGRSNVGKSSLLNSVFNHKKMVQVSKTPGRTRLINFFEVDKALMMVDLPGYGYAKVPGDIRKNWKPMIEKYLTDRKSLVGVVLLLDIRRMPSREDIDLWQWFHHFHKIVVPILTKGDKLSSQQQMNQAKKIAQVLDIPDGGVFVTSAKTHKGREQLRKVLTGLTWGFTPPDPADLIDETDETDVTNTEE